VAEISYPTTGGGSVTDARYEQLIGAVMPSGLIGTPLLSTVVYGDSSGRVVKARALRSAVVRGFRWETDGAGLTVNIAANSSGQPRYDLAVLRLNRSNWTLTFQIIQGTAAASPVLPSVTQQNLSTGVWEFPLARILVANNATQIHAADVTMLAPYIGRTPMLCTSSTRPSGEPNGTHIYEQDTGLTRVLANNGWIISNERSGVIPTVTPGGNWDSGASAGTVYRVNGLLVFNLTFRWAGGSVPANGSGANIASIPAFYRPADTTTIPGYLTRTGGMCTLLVNGGGNASDSVTLTMHPALAFNDLVNIRGVMPAFDPANPLLF
jgi:hypothetical protein